MEFKYVLITGGAGFIGSHVVNYFVKEYPNTFFIILDKLDYCGSKKNLRESLNSDNFVFVKGDINNYELINNLFITWNFDAVIHFAAQTHVDNSFGNSLEFTKTNVLGTHTLLECSKQFNIKKFIHVSTDEVYGEVIESAAGENAILNPNNPYACSKAGAEFMCQAYKRSFNMPIIITRGNNVFGTKQFPEKVIPKFIYQLLNLKRITIHGNGEVKRNFVHTNDVVSAFEKILLKGEIGEIYNIGSDDELTVKELAIKIISCIRDLTNLHPEMFSSEQIEYLNKYDIYEYLEQIEDRAFNDARYYIKSDKLKNLDWKCLYSLNDELYNVIIWYIKNNDWFTNNF